MNRIPCKTIIGTAAALIATACTNALGPDRGDPAQYAFTSPIRLLCGSWAPALPTQPLGLFDIYLDSNQLAADGGPTDAQSRVIVRLGGTIVYRYHLNIIRAILPWQAASRTGAGLVRGVMDARSTDVGVAVGFKTVIDPDLILTAGGRITYTFIHSPILFGYVPDARIPEIRSNTSVRYVERLEGGNCTGPD